MVDERVRSGGLTAVFTAKMRELESNREDAQIVDSLAGVFVSASGLDYSMVSLSDMTGERLFESNVIRTWWIDRGLDRALDAGCRQVVIVGGGLDSRAFRLQRPGVRWFEVEGAALGAFKRDVLTSEGMLDGRDDWVQVDASPAIADAWAEALPVLGFSREVATCWVWEGMFYLSGTECAEALRMMADMSSAGSRCIVAHFGPASLIEAQTQEMASQASSQAGRSFKSTVADPVEWSAAGGWSVLTAETIAAAGARIGREVVYSVAEQPGQEYTWLMDLVLA